MLVINNLPLKHYMPPDLSENSATKVFFKKPVSILTSIFAVSLICALSFTTILNSFSDFKNIINQNNSFQENNLAQVTSTTTTPVTAKKLFASNFGPGVTLGTLYNFSSKGAWQDLKGTDSETGYSFPVTGIPNQNFSGVQWIAYATITPDTIVDELSTEIRKVTGPVGTTVNELFTSVNKKGPLGLGSAQAQFMVRRDHKYGDINDMYITYWAKHPSDLITKLDPTVSSANWHAQFEFKTGGYENTGNGDYRIGTHIMKGTDGKLYWMTKGDNVANGPWPRVDYWREDNKIIPVPLDKWFKYEVYWHRSAGADGRYWTAVDGQVIADHKGPNMGDYNLPINRIFFAPAYSGGNTPVESHITGLEIWDNFPCGTGVSCYSSSTTLLDTLAPTPPTNLSASNITANNVTLNWSPSTDNTEVAGYNIYKNNTKLTNVTSNSYSDSSLTPSTTYTYAVTAIDKSGNESGFSNSVFVTTLNNLIPLTITSNSASVKASHATIGVTTNKPSTIVINYGTDANNLNLSAKTTTLVTNSNIVLSNLNRRTIYYYKVTATDQDGQSVTSSISSFKTKYFNL